MIYSAAAKFLAITHLAFILFVIAGGFLVLRWPRLMWLHLPAAIWGALIEFRSWHCPLTAWENAMLRRAGQAGYANGFIEHYILPVIYPTGLTRTMQVAAGLLVVIVNVAVYWRLYRRPARMARS